MRKVRSVNRHVAYRRAVWPLSGWAIVAALALGPAGFARAADKPTPDFSQPFVEQQKSAYGPELAQIYGQDPEPTAGPLQKAGSAGKGFFKSIGSAFKKKEKPLEPGRVKSDKHDPLSMENKPKPPDAEFYREVARFQEQSGALDGAEQSYRKGLAIAPRDRDSLLGLARLLNRRQRFDEAAKVFQQVTQLYPNDPAGYNDLGMCLGGQQKYSEAAAALARAVQLAPQRKLYRNNMALALVELRRYEEALSHLAVAHGEAVAHYNLGYMLTEKGDMQPARFHFGKALEKQPNFPEAQQWVDLIAARTQPQHNPVPSDTPWPVPQRTAPPPRNDVATVRQPPQLQAPPAGQGSKTSNASAPGAADLIQPLHVASVDQRSSEQIRDLPTPATSQLNPQIVDQIKPMLPAVVTTPAGQTPVAKPAPTKTVPRPASAGPMVQPAPPSAATQPNAPPPPSHHVPSVAPRVNRSAAAPYRPLPPSRY